VLLPGVEPGDHHGFVSLLGDEHDFVRAEAVEAALAVGVALPLIGCRELCNSLAEISEEFGTVGCGGHLLDLFVGADAMHPTSQGKSERSSPDGHRPECT